MKDIPAFPAMHYDLADNEHGLTMRDYFAAKAMQGFLASPLLKTESGADAMARNAYRVADAMMEERANDANA
jgi:hypothetical protein